MRILFDATVLRFGLQGNSARSGIFMVARELLREFVLREGLEVELTASPEATAEVRRFLASDGLLSGLPFCLGDAVRGQWALASFLSCGPLVPCDVWPLSFVRRSLGLGRRLCKAFFSAYVWMRGRTATMKLRKRYSAYFSPMYAAPDFIVRLGLPRYTVLYDTIPLLFPQYCPRPKGGELWQDELMRKLNRDDSGFAISMATKADFLKFKPELRAERIAVIPLGASCRFRRCEDAAQVQAVRGKYGIPAGRPYFFSLCTIEPRKNLGMALRAFAEFAKTDKDVLLVLSGGGWDSYQKTWDESMADVAAVRERIVLTGYVDDEDLPFLYSDALAFVFLSRYEGFGLPPLEAMSCGLPVICSNSSSLPEVVGDAALSVFPDDFEGVVSAMKRVATEPALREDLRRRGLLRARNFSWERAVDIILSTMCGQAFARRQIDYSRVSHSRSDVLIRGFSVPEAEHVWTDGKTATMRFLSPVAEDPRHVRLDLDVIPFIVQGKVPRQRMIVEVAGKRVGDFLFEAGGPQTRSVELEMADGRDVLVDFRFPDAMRPSDIGLSADSRQLAFAIRGVSFR